MGLEYPAGSILRRWKRNWFALWLDGTLGYYHDETAQDEEDRVLIHFNVRDIKVGQECHGEQKHFSGGTLSMVMFFSVSEDHNWEVFGCFQRAPTNTTSGPLPTAGQLAMS